MPPAALERRVSATPYAELHCHSTFSFLDGASHPEELAEEAVRLGLEALAITDHDGFYGVVRFAEAARAVGMPTVFGAELSLGLTKPQNGMPDPEGSHLLVLARDPRGLRPAGVDHQRRPAARAPRRASRSTTASPGRRSHGDHWVVLTGCRKGTVPQALERHGPAAAARELDALIATFGRHNVVVELCDHGDPLDSHRNDALAQIAVRAGVDVVATTNAHYAIAGPSSAGHRDGGGARAAQPRRARPVAARLRRAPTSARATSRRAASPAGPARWSGPPSSGGRAPSTCSWWRRSSRRSRAPTGSARWATSAASPPRARSGATASGATERVPGAYRQIEHELALIEQLGFPGYFLVVWDIVDFCRRSNIYCQGRGSAANSAVCYALGITNADAVSLGLLFERFLSPERDGPPDIDIDIESGRREEAIQYVYAKHGRRHAAQVANVITYRAKSSIRDVAKALGYASGQQDAWSKQVDAWGAVAATAQQQSGERSIPEDVLALAAELEHAPRHLGIHSGGMVICDRPIVEVCPVEWARLTGSTSKSKTLRGDEPIRTVLQWDKDDCAAIGLVKFDLLGLGMLEVLHGCIDLVREVHGDVDVDLATIPQEDEVYDMLCRADSVGVFQVESRAQMATLPRLRPREFYDLVVEVALIRPGPIQGGSVHPYIRRRNGLEEVTYLHPLLERSLKKTLGVPLFQEQLMQMAIDVGGFSPGEADMLRQAMGSKRSHERMERLHQRFADGAAARDVPPDVIEIIWEKLAAFASYGFPESHSVSFAYLVYASSWLKRWYPAAFCAALLDAQPMGFYAPHTLVQDARRHGVEVRTPDLNRAAATADVGHRSWRAMADRAASWGKAERDAPPEDWGKPGPAVRLGISYVRGIGLDLADGDRGRAALRRPGGPGPRACRSRCRSWRRWPPRVPSTASGCRGARRSGRPARWPRSASTATAPSGCPASSPAPTAPAAAGDDRRRVGARRPLGHRREPRGPPHPVHPRAPRLARRRHRHRPGRRRAGRAGAGGRRRHPPAASGHRRRHAVREPGGRDRPHQRGGVEGLLDRAPQGGPQRAGHARARSPRALRGRHQRHRRPPRGAPARARPPRAATSADAATPSGGRRPWTGARRASRDRRRRGWPAARGRRTPSRR